MSNSYICAYRKRTWDMILDICTYHAYVHTYIVICARTHIQKVHMQNNRWARISWRDIIDAQRMLAQKWKTSNLSHRTLLFGHFNPKIKNKPLDEETWIPMTYLMLHSEIYLSTPRLNNVSCQSCSPGFQNHHHCSRYYSCSKQTSNKANNINSSCSK